MPERPTTPEGTPIGGWVFVVPDAAPVTEALKAFGQIHRWPVPVGPRARLLRAGQPCFLVVTEVGAKVKPGLWAVGEVVGPVTDGAVADPDTMWAEVELLPLATRVPLAALHADERLAGSELVTDPHGPAPRALRPEEVRVLEDHDFDLRPPTEAQVARLDEALTAEDPLVLEVVGADRSVAVIDDAGPGDGRLVVVALTDEGTYELGRYAVFADALEAVAHHSEALELPAPPPPGSGGLGPPVIMLRTEDGPLVVARTGPDRFELHHDADEPPLVLTGLDEALAAIGEAVEEVPDDPVTGPTAS